MNKQDVISSQKEDLRRYIGQMGQIAGIQSVDVNDGRGRGNRNFHVYTGSGLCFDVVVDRGMDILGFSYQGKSMVWHSPVGQAASSYYEPEGLGWLRTFQGGLLQTCGLDQVGIPNEDEGEHFGQHGRYSTQPAHEVTHSTGWVGDKYVLEMSGKVRQTRFFGENLLLTRKISTAMGSNTIRIADEVVNDGFARQPHMIMYHCNFGYPLLSEDTVLVIDSKHSEPRDEEAAKGFDRWMYFEPPTPGYAEQCFLHQPELDDDGMATVRIQNPKLGLGVKMRFDGRTLPHIVEWKMMGEGAYVLGVEPNNTGSLFGRAAAKADGSLIYLEPGESVNYLLEISVEEI
ncbi:MAG: aldose 1-epimerase family protein [Anaerolineaceae bacterium]|nr:aldose 1-epimerase family protein [Anaerolineaceae bacterium]